MRRKILLATVLCLAVAALGIWAAPALAADGCTCHTAVPPTAPAAHAPFVAGVSDCTTCHAGWTVPHPESIAPTLTLVALRKFAPIAFVSISLYRPWVPLPGVPFFVQRRPSDTAAYTTVWQTVTDAQGRWNHVFYKGNAFEYRAISRGIAGPPVLLPALSVHPAELPTPTLTIRLRGVAHGVVKLGRAVRVAGRAAPVDLAGQTLRLRLQRRLDGKWGTRRAVTCTIGTDGTYTWAYTPKRKGLFRVRATIAATVAYQATATDWRRFRVR